MAADDLAALLDGRPPDISAVVRRAQLPDPSGLLEGSGKRARHVRCRTVADVERPAMRVLIQARAALRGGS